MIVLNNIKKSYRSKKGGSHEALKGISLTLPSRGMVFLLGKSGSGKSTLLNIIGLLDTATEGTLEINGVVPEGKLLDDLRNEYSSFVFQEFALLEDETIGQNVRLALQLQSVKDTDERVKQALERVGLAGYEKRFPAELSGGEKQRVAIARALIKNSEIILADEPTGNLDSENGEEVFEILKSLSKEKLVLIVSHDRESAQKYADRIIEIKDGLIVSDTAPEVKEEKREADKGIKSHLPTALALRMGWRNFGKKKVRSAMTFIVAILAMTILAFAEVFASFTGERAIAKTIVKNDLDYITLQHVEEKIEDLSSRYGSHPFDFDEDCRSKLKKFTYLERMNGNQGRLPNAYVVDGMSKVNALGFEFYDGALELTDESVYTTDFMIDEMRRDTMFCTAVNAVYCVREGEELIPISDNRYDYRSLIGKTIWIRGAGFFEYQNLEIQLAGIIKTNYEDYYAYTEEGFFVGFPVKREGALGERDKQTRGFRTSAIYRSIFCTRDFYLHHQVSVGGSKSGFDFETYMVQGNTALLLNEEITIYHNFLGGGRNEPILIADSKTCVTGKEISLKADEIVIDQKLYNQAFGNEISYSDFVTASYDYELRDNVYTVKKYPEHLGDEIHLAFKRKNKNYEKAYKVVGVIMGERYEEIRWSHAAFLSDEGMAEFVDALCNTSEILLNVQHLREGKIRRLLTALRYDYNLRTDFAYSQRIYDNEPLERLIGYAFLIVGTIMILITLLVVVSLISYNIIAQKKEIGILRALGARASDVAKIYLCQAAILSVVVFALSAVLSAILIAVLNGLLANYWIAGLMTVGYSVFSWLILFVGSFVALFLATSLPLKKISRQKPADAIKKG